MEKGDLRKDILWNTAGSLMLALSSVLLGFAAIRFLGGDEGGVFAFGFSTFGQQMFIVAYFGIRPFHITDVGREYSPEDYRRARCKTCLLALSVSLLWLSVLAVTGTYTAKKALSVLLLSLYKIGDGLADCYECECQRQGRLWQGGRALFIRCFFCTVFFLLLLIFTGDLLLSSLFSCLLQYAFAIFYMRKREGGTETAGRPFSPDTGSKDMALLRSTFLLFLGVFLDFFVFSSAKYAIDLLLTDTESGVFNILFMPTNVIYLAANFVIKPYLTRMAEKKKDGDEQGFSEIKRKIMLIIAGLTALALLGAAVLARPVLGLFERMLGGGLDGKLAVHTPEFLLIILGGGLYALANLYYYILVICRRQKRIFAVYAAAAAAALFLSAVMVKNFGIPGAAISYTALMLLLVTGFASVNTKSTR